MMLIGLCGKARSGKDTAAEILVSRHGFIRMAFADPLKEAAAALWDVPVTEFHDNISKDKLDPRWGITRRAMMQKLGDMVKDNLDRNFWTSYWFMKYSTLPRGACVVVTDVRFNREAERLIQLGGTILEITRDGAGLKGAEATHSSEKGIRRDLISHTIENDGFRSDLAHDIVKFVLAMTEPGWCD